jgi:hypothetical protein
MKKTLLILLASILGSFFLNTAYADGYIYRYKDTHGNWVYTDNLPASEKGTYTVLSGRTGTIKEVVDRQLNPDEIAQKENKEEEDKKIQVANELQKKKDVALLSTYANINDIDKMKSYELGQIDQAIRSGIDVTSHLKDRLNQLDSVRQASPGDKKTQDEYVKTQASLDEANKNLEANKELFAQRTKKYDDDKARYTQILQDMGNKKPNDVNQQVSQNTN